MTGRLERVAETDRPAVRIFVDGDAVDALQDDTLLVAILTARRHLRRSEFGGEIRAGFCAMSACQDCWVWTDEGTRLRSCTTTVSEGLRISTVGPGSEWLTNKS